MQVPLFYRSKQTFGLDIGRTTIKIAQVKKTRDQVQAIGYGYAHFDKNAITNGQITDIKPVAEAIKSILQEKSTGKITASRVMMSVPMANSYTRIVTLPLMPSKDLLEAVKLEAEQYIPVESKNLYIEYSVLSKDKTNLTILVVAVPKKVIDSHVALCEGLGLEVAAIEPNMFSNLRSVEFNCTKPEPKIVIDFGAHSSDLAIYDTAIRLTSTIATGGDNITEAIAAGLRVTTEEAHRIKIRYGIAKSRWQVQLASILQPILSNFANEVQKTMRYYHEHTEGKTDIGEIFMVGGGANMPGVSDFLSHLTGVDVRTCDPWKNLAVKPLQPPHPAETTIYATAVGLALRESNDGN